MRALRVAEPATMLTDFAIAVTCVAFAIGIARVAAGSSARELWTLGFGLTAGAALVGGMVHGLAPHLAAPVGRRLWKAMQYLLGLTGLAMLGGAVHAFASGRTQTVLLGGAVVKFACYAAAVRRRDDYSLVVADYGASMVAVAALAITGWVRHGAPASPWLLAGVVVSAIAAAVQVRKVAPHAHFNHNDLYHVIQLVALYLFFRGGLLLVDV